MWEAIGMITVAAFALIGFILICSLVYKGLVE